MEQSILTTDLHFKWERYGDPSAEGRCTRALLQSIGVNGILNPLLITKGEDGLWYVWLGNQRLEAARILGLTRVYCVVVNSKAEVVEAFDSYQEV